MRTRASPPPPRGRAPAAGRWRARSARPAPAAVGGEPAAAAAPAAAPAAVERPGSGCVARLPCKATGGEALVVGISHVSMVSLEDVRRAVRRSRPDAVLLELCRERVGFLLDAELEPSAATRWAAGRVTLTAPASLGWDLAAVAAGLPVREGRPFSQADVFAAWDALEAAAGPGCTVQAFAAAPSRGEMSRFFPGGAGLVEAQPLKELWLKVEEGRRREGGEGRRKVYGLYKYVTPTNGAKVAADAERRAGGAVEDGADFQAALAEFLTARFAEGQAEAAEQAGIARPGEAWRVAMEEAAALGARHVVLGDQVTSVTRRRMGQLVGANLRQQGWVAPVAAGAGVVGFGGAAALASAGAVPADPLLVGALGATASVLVGGAAALYFLSSPIREIREFAAKDRAEIDDIVRDDLSGGGEAADGYLDGEDALIAWSEEAIIGERDVFQAEALHKLLVGDLEDLPGYVLDGDGGFRYRARLGKVAEPTPKTVVGVVGAAHLRGIEAHWAAMDW